MKFALNMVHSAPKQHGSNMKDLWITDYHNKYDNNGSFEILQKLPNRDREIRNEQILWGKWADLLDAKLPKTFSL